MEDSFQLPEDMDPGLKRLFNQLLEAVMSEALKDPEGSQRAGIIEVVDLLAARLRDHWEGAGESGGEPSAAEGT